LAAEHTAGV